MSYAEVLEIESAVTLRDMEHRARQLYVRAQRDGMTVRQMATVSGLPESTISMWLRGYRPIAKIDVLQALIDGAPQVEMYRMG